MTKVAVLVSGGGTNLQAIIDCFQEGSITNASLELVISNKADAYALERAEKHGIENRVIAVKQYSTREEYGAAMIQCMEEKQIDLVVLAGFLVILPENLVRHYEGRMINIHPSLIPSHCGPGYYGLKVHEQEVLQKRVMEQAEWHILPQAIDDIANDRLVIVNDIVKHK